MEAIVNNPYDDLVSRKIYKHARGFIVRLIGLTLTGVALTAIGQPTSEHHLSSFGHTFWNSLLVVHLLFLLFLTLNAIVIMKLAVQRFRPLRSRATVGLLAIGFGMLNGALSFHKVHPALTLFCVGLATVVLAVTYAPILTRVGGKKRPS